MPESASRNVEDLERGNAEFATGSDRALGQFESEHEAQSLGDSVATRVIALRTMSPRLRLVTGVAVAQAIVAAIFLALRGVHLPLTIASNIASARVGVIAIPTLVLWIAVVFLSVSWAYLLAGGFDSAWGIRLAITLLFTGNVLLLWLNAGFHGPFALCEALVLGGIWVVALSTWWRRSRSGGTDSDAASERRHPRILGVAILTLAISGIYLLVWFGPSTSGPASQQFASAVFEQVIVLAIILVPALLLAAGEFGEWGEVLGDGLGALSRAHRWHRGAVEVALTVGVAVAILAHSAVRSSGNLPTELACAAAVAVALGLAARGLRAHGAHAVARTLPYGALVLAAVSLFVLTSADLLIRTSSTILPSARELAIGGTLVPYGQAGSPPFAMEYPSGWTVERVPPDYTIFNGASFGSVFEVLRVQVPADKFQQVLGESPQQSIATIVEGVAAQISRPAASVATGRFGHQGPWTVQLFSITKPGRSIPWEIGAGWERVVRGRVWVLLGSVKLEQSFTRDRAHLFTQMVTSWSPDPRAYAGSGPPRATASVGGYPGWALGAWAVIGLGCLVLLWRRGARMRSSRAATLLFLLAVAAFFVASAGTSDGAALGARYLHLAGTQAAVAIGSLLWLAACAVRRTTSMSFGRQVSLVLMVNVGLQVVVWMYQLYGGALAVGGQFSVAQGLIVLAALVWELIFSGVTMTNVHSKRFPRHARVLVFCGYIMLVSTTVMFFSSLHVQSTGTRLEPVFESEAWVQRGMVVLAVPMLITVFVLRWLAANRARGDAGDGRPGDAQERPVISGAGSTD